MSQHLCSRPATAQLQNTQTHDQNSAAAVADHALLNPTAPCVQSQNQAAARNQCLHVRTALALCTFPPSPSMSCAVCTCTHVVFALCSRHPSCGSHDGPSEPATKQQMWPRQQTRPPASSSVFRPVVGQDESNEGRFSGIRRLPAKAVRSLLQATPPRQQQQLLLLHTTHFYSGIVAICVAMLERLFAAFGGVQNPTQRRTRHPSRAAAMPNNKSKEEKVRAQKREAQVDRQRVFRQLKSKYVPTVEVESIDHHFGASSSTRPSIEEKNLESTGKARHIEVVRRGKIDKRRKKK
ncbi:hypothetical protein IWX48DRAFT_593452 [Phyllosticta citricarpa]